MHQAWSAALKKWTWLARMISAIVPRGSVVASIASSWVLVWSGRPDQALSAACQSARSS